jgi:LPS-assembly protein
VRRRNGVFSLVVLFSLALVVPQLYALERGAKVKDGPVFIEADRISYEGSGDSYRAEGNVLITFSDGYLKADSATLYHAENKARADGNVRLKNGNDLVEGESVFFDLGSKTGAVENGGMFVSDNHLYIRGEKIEKKTGASYHLKNGSMTTCDSTNPDWKIAAQELDVTIDGYGTLKHGRFLAREIPLLYIPWLIFPAKTTRQTGFLLPHIAYSGDKNGLDVEVPFYWAVSQSADMTFYQRYIEKRGFKEGVEFRYFPDQGFSGVFYGDFIHDRKTTTGTAGTTNEDSPCNKRRWSYYCNHESTLANGLNIKADLNRVSDHWYFRDFESFNYYTDHYFVGQEDRFKRVSFKGDESVSYLYSTLAVTKDWQLYNLTALAKYTDDFSTADNAATLQKYPEVILTGFRQSLFDSSLQMDFTTGYDYYYSDEGQRGHLWELSPTFYLPFNLGKYFHVTPWTGVRSSVWNRTDSLMGAVNKNNERNVLDMGATISTEFSRIFTVNSKSLEKLRHVIKPELSYQYIPYVSDETIPVFVDAMSEYNAATYGIVSTLTAKIRRDDKTSLYRELMRFKISQIYDITEARRDCPAGQQDNRPFGDILTELDVLPFQYVSLYARNTFDVQSGGMKQNNYDLILSDSRGDSISAGYRYTRDALEGINLSVRARIAQSLEIAYVLSENRLERRTVESTVGAFYRKQCWSVGVTVSEEEEEDGKRDRSFMVYFSLLGLGGSH